MSPLNIVDTFPAFLTCWALAQADPLERQIERWASEYMAQWPELLAKLQADYAGQGADWRQIARERVFPFVQARLPAMAKARKHLCRLSPALYQRAQRTLAFDADITFVIYVGIGCGAGWATTYQDRPAILFGLENIAECGWSDADSIAGLLAHELGHLAHTAWRAQRALSDGDGPWWQLYCEGFATRCEQVILGEGSWHESSRTGDDSWLEWCQSRKGWLAAEFLRAVSAGEPVHRFFGSWYEMDGHSQSGYFLGHEIVKELEAGGALREIAMLDDIERHFRPILEALAGPGAARLRSDAT